jgi:hypothetical protein
MLILNNPGLGLQFPPPILPLLHKAHLRVPITAHLPTILHLPIHTTLKLLYGLPILDQHLCLFFLGCVVGADELGGGVAGAADSAFVFLFAVGEDIAGGFAAGWF